MRFDLYFFAFLLVLCSWNLHQAFGERKLTLEAVECYKDDVVCGVEILVTTDHHDIYFSRAPFVRRLVVLKAILADAGMAPNAVNEVSKVKEYITKCIKDFCVSIRKTGFPDLRMSHSDPLNFPLPFADLKLLTEIEHIESAPEVPQWVDLLKFNFNCTEVRGCTVVVSAYGVKTKQFELSHYSTTKFITSNYIWASNGVGQCFNEYCVFLPKMESEIRGNFDGNAYANDPPKLLTPDAKTKVVELYNLKPLRVLPQVTVGFPCIEGKCNMTCVFQEDDQVNNMGVSRLEMPIPSNFTLKELQPIQQFTAKNGRGICAGYHCCFHNMKDKTKLFVNFNYSINSNSTALPEWFKENPTKLIKMAVAYSGVNNHAEFLVQANTSSAFGFAASAIFIILSAFMFLA